MIIFAKESINHRCCDYKYSKCAIISDGLHLSGQNGLNLNPHLHIICIDSVYSRYSDFAKFRNLDRLTDDEVASLVESIATTSNPTAKHLKGLRALAEERIFKRFLLVCDVATERRTEDGIEILPWETFLNRLWAGDCV